MILSPGATTPEDFFHRSQIFILSSSTRRQCLAIPIVHDATFENTEFFNVELFRDNLLPGFVSLSPNSTVVRIMHVNSKWSNIMPYNVAHCHAIVGLAIGFERTSIPAYENAGPVSVCVRVLQPADPTADIGNTHYSISLTTDFRPGPNSKFCS